MASRFTRQLAAWVLLLLAGSVHAQQPEDLLSRYRLGSGDVISIVVLGEDELKREKIRLTDAGTIQFPVLGELRIRGLTLGEIEQRITSGLKGGYLVNPKVTVSIDEYRPFFINGEVSKPGGYPYVPGLNVLKAITLAGGYKDRAAKDKIFVVRDGKPSQAREKVDVNTPVFPGDILTVEESFF
jgi:protein involved in polysaccharide export with SLBB domain